MLESLLEIGFRKVGKVRLIDGEILIEIFEESESKNILYSFVSNNEPLYVGKTTQTLKRRMYGYKNPGKTQATNIRNNRNLKDILKSGETVDLFVLPDHGLLHFGKFHLNLAAGLEDNIVKLLAPKWNMTGK